MRGGGGQENTKTDVGGQGVWGRHTCGHALSQLRGRDPNGIDSPPIGIIYSWSGAKFARCLPTQPRLVRDVSFTEAELGKTELH